jgi:calcium channel MID1
MVSNATVWGKLSGPSQGLPPTRLRRRSGGDIDGDLEASTLNLADPEEATITYGDDTEDLTLRSRQLPTRPLYITINTCLQPTNPNDPTKGPPNQLQLYVSQTAQNLINGPGNPDASWKMKEAEGGFASITEAASGDVFIGVYAPPTDGFTAGVYSVEIGASIDAPFHNYNNSQRNLYLVDSDSNSALLVTNNLTLSTNGSVYDAWMSLTPPFVIFAANQNKTDFAGVQNSYCGLEKAAQIAGTKGGVRSSVVQTSMTNVTSGPFPKQQFYFQGLNGSSSYHGTLAMFGNSTSSGNGVVGGGGQVWQTMNFSTQSGILTVF